MSEQYRLAYSGEVLEGQHPAVVKKRLATLLKLDDDRMDVLFSGKQVVVKRATDAKTAARYQDAFNKAGARLRVLPVEGGGPAAHDKTADTQSAPAVQAQQQTVAAPSGAARSGNLEVLPAGSEVLREEERAASAEADIDTSHLSVQGATFSVPEPEPEKAAPNVDHLTVAEPGADLGAGQADEPAVDIDADFDLAEPGATLETLPADASPTVDVEAIDFEVAEPGADIGDAPAQPERSAPDTSHLSLEEKPSDQA